MSTKPHPKKSPKKSHTKSSPSSLKPDRALKEKWERELAVYTAAVARDAKAFDQKYEAIARIIDHDPPLYLAAGCKTFHDFVTKYVHEDDTVVRKWVEVAKLASPKEEALWSPSRLALLLGYLRATSVDGKLLKKFQWDKIMVNIAPKGREEKFIRGVDATLDQLRSARTYALQRLGKTPPGTSSVAKQLLHQLQSAGADNVSVRYHDGSYTVTFEGYQARTVGRVIAAIDGAAVSDVNLKSPANSASKAIANKVRKTRRG